MNKNVSSAIKLVVSLGLGALIIFLVANNFKKPLKVKINPKLEKNEQWEIKNLVAVGDYIQVDDTLASIYKFSGGGDYLISIYEGEVKELTFADGDKVQPGDIAAKVKVDIWKIVSEAFKKTNYWWILLSIVLALCSHFSRAIRWKMLFKPMGYNPSLGNSFGAILVMYMANLAFPRLGEVLRCTILARYEKIPMEKSLGTMITERAIDLICLLSVVGLCLIFQRQIFIDFYNTHMGGDGGGYTKYIILGALGFVAGIAFLLFKSGKLPMADKITDLVKGLWAGIISVKDLKNPAAFIGHTVFIWVMYYLMIAVCFEALPETKDITWLAALPVLFFGGIAMVAVQGGLGLYPFFVSEVLVMYGLAKTVGYAFGWVIWSGQTAIVVVAGLAAYFLLILLNKDKSEEQAQAEPATK